MPFSRSSPADSAGRSVRWQSGTTAAPSTARSTIIRASAGACIGSPSRGMRRSEIGRYLCLGADVIGNQCIAPLMPQPMMGFAPLNPSYKLVGSEACRERETELCNHRRGNRRARGRRVPGSAGRKGYDLRAGETIPADRRRYSDEPQCHAGAARARAGAAVAQGRLRAAVLGQPRMGQRRAFVRAQPRRSSREKIRRAVPAPASRRPAFRPVLGRALGADPVRQATDRHRSPRRDRKSTRLNSSHSQISYAVFCLKKKKKKKKIHTKKKKKQKKKKK